MCDSSLAGAGGGLRRCLVYRLLGLDGLRFRLWLRFRLGLLVLRDGLRRLHAATRPRTREVLVQLGYPLTKVGVLLDEAGQLVLNQVEKRVDFVLVVATLANGRLAERDVMDVGWCKRHCLPP